MTNKILIIKTSSLGDLIHTFPAIAYLKERLPQCEIDWVVERPFSELIEAHPLVNRAICIDTKQWRRGWLQRDSIRNTLAFRQALRADKYDLVFDFQGNMKSGLITSQVRATTKVGFNRHSVREWPNCLFTHKRFAVPIKGNVREENLGLVKAYFADTNLEPFIDPGVLLHITPEQHTTIANIVNKPTSKHKQHVMVCPGSQWPNKQVTTEALIDFLSLLQPQLDCFFYLVWGSMDEKKIATEIQSHPALQACSTVVNRMPLPTLQNLMHSMDLVIAMDSLPLHLAGTTGTATFGIFGASSMDKYKPQGAQHIAIQGSCPYGRRFDRRCPILRTCATGSCIRGLTGRQIFDKWLRAKRVPCPCPCPCPEK